MKASNKDSKKGRRLTVGELAPRVWRESLDDNVLGTAAELSYYFLLALFPLLIFMTSIIGFLPGADNSLLIGLQRALPPDAMKLVREVLDDVVSHRSGGLLSFALIGTVWAASSGVGSLMDALNTAYETTERRSFWKQRLVAIALTLIFALLVVGGSGLIMIGHRLGGWLDRALELSAAVAFASTVLGYVTGLGLLLAGIAALYYFGPNIKPAERRVLPGALFASMGVVIGSLLFSVYLRVAPSASATYGSLGAVVTLMLWLYLIGLLLLVGGEINSEVARAAKPDA
ncbi:MAG: YihY/virulence factor BrkB family protein [Acidobacteriota bacterium]